jgi:hypothetical protein
MKYMFDLSVKYVIFVRLAEQGEPHGGRGARLVLRGLVPLNE